MATVAAAPGAGKTVFAGLIFEALREADVADRMVIFVPRRSLVTQWVDALHIARHLELKPFSATERPGQQVGTVDTYQSLESHNALDAHRQMATNKRTLLVVDEVHHLGEKPSGNQPSWARNIAELAGEIGNLRVTGILNLSGTLWRSAPTERISTVRYFPVDQGRLQSEVDFEVTTQELVLRGQLRPIDLYRLDTKILLADYRDSKKIQGNLSELNEQQTRASMASLGSVRQWRSEFVAAVLKRLEKAHRALDGYHAKAIIVASRQDHARAFCDEVNRQRQAVGLHPFALLAVSDDDDAQKTLKDFKEQKKSGVLCTVDMAGEGYDCPDIAVVGFASNKLTAMYVRQVIARAMRVTQKERELQIIPAAVVIPDAQPLVEQLVAYLAPYTAEVLVPDAESQEATARQGGDPRQLDMLSISAVRFGLQEASANSQLVTIAYADKSHEDIDALLSDRFGDELQRAGVPAVFAPRILAASRRTVGSLRDDRPFDQAGADVGVLDRLTKGTTTAKKVDEAVKVAPMGEEERAQHLQGQIKVCAGWWEKNGDTTVAYFQSDLNKAAGIRAGRRDQASLEQLVKAYEYAKQRIIEHCKRSGKRPPRFTGLR